MFALDTNALVHFFKGEGRVALHLLETPPRDIAIPAIVLFELEVGIAKSTQSSKRRAQLDQLLNLVTLLPFDRPASKAAAEVKAELEVAGNQIGPMDVLIAGTALANAAILVSHNQRKFARVPGLRTVDWY